jgi:hypothetical protein
MTATATRQRVEIPTSLHNIIAELAATANKPVAAMVTELLYDALGERAPHAEQPTGACQVCGKQIVVSICRPCEHTMRQTRWSY